MKYSESYIQKVEKEIQELIEMLYGEYPFEIIEEEEEK